MSKFKKVILTAIICAIIFSLVGSWIFVGDWPFLPFLLLAGFFMVIIQSEERSYKFLDKLAIGSLVFGFLTWFLFILKIYLVSRFIYGQNGLPLFNQDSLAMALVFSLVSFLGGLLAIVLKGFYILYKNKLEKIIIFVGPVVLTLASLSVSQIKYGGTIMFKVYGWPRPYLIYQVRDVIDGFLIDRWIFSPGSLYHYLVENYLFYFLVLALFAVLIKIINQELKKTKINLVLALFTLLVLATILFTSHRAVRESYISRQIAKAGYCEVDSDCVIAGNKCPFSCAITVNKKEATRIMRLVNSFDSTCVYGCIELRSAICEKKHCQPVQ